MLPQKQMFSIVEAIAAAPLPTGKTARKLTFAGGEPTLCPWLPELIAHANPEGRAKFFMQYERRMERQFYSEAHGHRTTLRQQLEAQATQLKSALDEPAKFEPFLMN